MAYQQKLPRQQSCGLDVIMEVIGGKWKPNLICYIRQGLLRPAQLQKALPAANPRVLAQQLRELEQQGIVARKIYPELPPKVEYTLTALGESLLPVIRSMEAWGLAHQDVIPPAGMLLRSASGTEEA